MNQTFPSPMPEPTEPVRFFALVPCAGSGTRAQTAGPKQYEHVAGRAVVAHTLAALAAVERIECTLVVLGADDAEFEHHAPDFDGWVERAGGATRAETVANGLQCLRDLGADRCDWVLVHDAARCLLQPAWVDTLIDACAGHPVGGLLALPVADTLKREGSGAQQGHVECTVERDGMWQAQTPQMFRLGELQDALAQGHEVTDEAGAMQAAGLSPKLVRGSLENFKLTFPVDFDLADRLLRSRP